MKLSLENILKITEGNLLKGNELNTKFGVSTDTRKITINDLYLPLKGEKFDGHDFIKQAVDNNCRGYFIEKDRLTDEIIQAEFVIAVKNTLEAYLKIAKYIRNTINPKTIAITGSSGKTSTKEFINAVLSTTYKTHKSYLNHNNEIGLCQTMMLMPEDSEFVVIEMGMRGLGEIELLSKYSEPDITVITNIGTAHIGRLGSIENIAKAKCEITSYLKETGMLLAYDDKLIKQQSNWNGKTVFYGKEYEITKQEEGLTGFIYKDEYYEVPAMGEYNVINAIAAIEIGKYTDIANENIKKGLMNYVPVGDRGKIINLPDGTKFILDCYNANPDSVMASIRSVAGTYKNKNITLVIGNMEELGTHEQELHENVGNFITKHNIHRLITVGEKAKMIAQTADKCLIESFSYNEEAQAFLKNNIEKESVVLFKASRSMKFEELANNLI